MTDFSITNLIDLINEVNEQDAASEINISIEDAKKTFDELGLDSLTILSVVAQLEKKLGIAIGLEAGVAAETPDGLLALIANRLGPTVLVA